MLKCSKKGSESRLRQNPKTWMVFVRHGMELEWWSDEKSILQHFNSPKKPAGVSLVFKNFLTVLITIFLPSFILFSLFLIHTNIIV